MEASELLEKIEAQRREGDQFIRWWRKENDFVDYELIDRFLQRFDDSQVPDGFELLDIETMWQKLKDRVGERVVREKHKQGEMIVWTRPDRQAETCVFNAETIMAIFDEETGGDVIED
jgi:hypothetical protein